MDFLSNAQSWTRGDDKAIIKGVDLLTDRASPFVAFGFVCLGAISDCAQGLLFALNSGIIPAGA